MYRFPLRSHFPSRLSMLWALFSSFFSSLCWDRYSWEADLTGWREPLFLFEDAPLKAETRKEKSELKLRTYCIWKI